VLSPFAFSCPELTGRACALGDEGSEATALPANERVERSDSLLGVVPSVDGELLVFAAGRPDVAPSVDRGAPIVEGPPLRRRIDHPRER